MKQTLRKRILSSMLAGILLLSAAWMPTAAAQTDAPAPSEAPQLLYPTGDLLKMPAPQAEGWTPTLTPDFGPWASTGLQYKAQAADGEHADLIDRVVLPDFAHTFYEWLVENTDGDRVQDEVILAAASGQTICSYPVQLPVSAASQAELNDKMYGERDAAIEAAYLAFCCYWYGCYDNQVLPNGYGNDLLTGRFGYSLRMETLSSTQGRISITLQLELNPVDSAAYYAALDKQSDAIDRILADMPANVSRYEQISYLNDYLTLHNCYNSSYPNVPDIAHKGITALTGSVGPNGPVCDGYSKAFKMLCDAAGIPCAFVTGTAGGGGHAWNQVQMENGKWYDVDVTWNDPVTGTTAAVSHYENRDYLLVGEKTVINGAPFGQSHVLDNTSKTGYDISINGSHFLLPGAPTGEQEAYPNLCNHRLTSYPAKAATCTEPGHNAYTACSQCDYTTYVAIPATGHKLTSYPAKAATCTEPGHKAYTACSQCDYTTYVAIPKADHRYENGVCTICGALESLPFTDVPADAWYTDAVRFAVSRGLMSGVGNNQFAPENTMTRAMLVTVLWSHAGKPTGGTNQFVDVPNNEWYTQAVTWAAANGIVSGTGNNCFDPNSSITREQMIAILYKYSQKRGIDTSKRGDLSGFSDQDTISSWARESVAWAVSEGYMAGYAGKLTPRDNVTRAQVAAILRSYLLKTEG